MWNPHQIWNPMTVLKSACHEDFKTSPTCSIWWSFGWDIWWLRQLIPLQNLISSQLLFLLQNWSLAFNLAYLSHFFIKFKDQGQFWSLLAWGFWNCHWFWKLMKNWLRYSKLKARLNFWRSNKGWDEIKFWSGINCL